MGRILAAADIGSNTVHLLVAEIQNGQLRRLRNENAWLSLGEIVTRTGTIPEGEVFELVSTIAKFAQISRSEKAESLYVFATEAMRQAPNHDNILKRIGREAQVEVDLISPLRETELSRRGVQMDTALSSPFWMIEVGGGSAQVARCDQTAVLGGLSLPLGSGRLIADWNLEHPANNVIIQELRENIRRELEPISKLGSAEKVVASGGVARGLWRALHPDEDKILSKEELEYLIWATTRLSLQQIVRRFGVKPKRAGTLLPGAIVYLELLNKLRFDEMTVSEYGVREGAVLEMAEGKIEPCRV